MKPFLLAISIILVAGCTDTPSTPTAKPEPIVIESINDEFSLLKVNSRPEAKLRQPNINYAEIIRSWIILNQDKEIVNIYTLPGNYNSFLIRFTTKADTPLQEVIQVDVPTELPKAYKTSTLLYTYSNEICGCIGVKP